jgi:thioredoxin 1
MRRCALLLLGVALLGCRGEATDATAPSGDVPLVEPAAAQANASETPAPPGSMPAGDSACVTVGDETFAGLVAQNPLPVLVVFYTADARGSDAILPVLEQLARDYRGRAVVGRLETSSNPFLTNRYRVDVVPTAIIFQSGHPVDIRAGSVTETRLRSMLDAVAPR